MAEDNVQTRSGVPDLVELSPNEVERLAGLGFNVDVVDGCFVSVHQYQRILDRRMELVKKRKAAAEAELEVIKPKLVKAMSEELEIKINIDTTRQVLAKLEKEQLKHRPVISQLFETK